MLVDLRSDTVTKPTPGMRAAMAAADVGDDVYGEDPSVRRLEDTVAALFDKPAAVFVPTGTMGNQICLRLVCPPADEVLCDADAHVVTYEGGGAAQHGGLQTRTVVTERGLLSPAEVARQIRTPQWGTVVTRAVAVEHTHNRGGGAVYPLATLTELRGLTREHDVALHCDGARVWNAHVTTGTSLASYGALFDTMSVCLSKGLGAPVGSLVVCDAEKADEARTLRRRLGGSWRQAGVLAAAGLYAIEHHVQRLADDHTRAKRLAGQLSDAAPGSCDPDAVETNIVPLDLSVTPWTTTSLVAAAREDGVLVSPIGPRRARLVTHLDLDDEAVDTAAKVLGQLLASGG
ncbi:MAG: threonine aldolase family protein [Actinomycetes bacterium]